MTQARLTNYGTRIDYILLLLPCTALHHPPDTSYTIPSSSSPSIITSGAPSLGSILSADILPHIMGSDHCPTYCIIAITPNCVYNTHTHENTSTANTNPELPSLCTALIPLFSHKQLSIKNMWMVPFASTGTHNIMNTKDNIRISNLVENNSINNNNTKITVRVVDDMGNIHPQDSQWTDHLNVAKDIASTSNLKRKSNTNISTANTITKQSKLSSFLINNNNSSTTTNNNNCKDTNNSAKKVTVSNMGESYQCVYCTFENNTKQSTSNKSNKRICIMCNMEQTSGEPVKLIPEEVDSMNVYNNLAVIKSPTNQDCYSISSVTSSITPNTGTSSNTDLESSCSHAKDLPPTSNNNNNNNNTTATNGISNSASTKVNAFGMLSNAQNKITIPNCTVHNLPCVMNVVLKDGPNKGRRYASTEPLNMVIIIYLCIYRFFCCAQPVGAPGNPLSRCKYFQWDEVGVIMSIYIII